jgi:putative molybdopterin biosynthesis protein
MGLADTGIAIEAAAHAEGLDFIPLAEERFDLVVPEARHDERPVSRLLDLIGGRRFQADARPLAGYDLSTAGHASTVAGRTARA